MSDAATGNQRTPFPAFLFGFRGRIGPVQYWISIGCALALFIAGIAFPAAAMAPTGGGAPILAIPLLCLFVWIIAAAMAQRLRAAGKSSWLALVFVTFLLAWQFLAIELIEYAALLGILGFVAILALVGHIGALSKMKEDRA